MRFSIRELMLVTVIVGLAVGWWVDRSRLARLLQDCENVEESLVLILDSFDPNWRDLPKSEAPTIPPNP